MLEQTQLATFNYIVHVGFIYQGIIKSLAWLKNRNNKVIFFFSNAFVWECLWICAFQCFLYCLHNLFPYRSVHTYTQLHIIIHHITVLKSELLKSLCSKLYLLIWQTHHHFPLPCVFFFRSMSSCSLIIVAIATTHPRLTGISVQSHSQGAFNLFLLVARTTRAKVVTVVKRPQRLRSVFTP